MDRNIYYNFKELCNAVFWLSPESIRVYLSNGRMPIRSIFDQNTGRKCFLIEDVNKYIDENKPSKTMIKKKMERKGMK